MIEKIFSLDLSSLTADDLLSIAKELSLARLNENKAIAEFLSSKVKDVSTVGTENLDKLGKLMDAVRIPEENCGFMAGGHD